MSDKYTIGLAYGTDSVRSLIVNTRTGEEVASAVFEYPRWKEGNYCEGIRASPGGCQRPPGEPRYLCGAGPRHLLRVLRGPPLRPGVEAP